MYIIRIINYKTAENRLYLYNRSTTYGSFEQEANPLQGVS